MAPLSRLDCEGESESESENENENENENESAHRRARCCVPSWSSPPDADCRCQIRSATTAEVMQRIAASPNEIQSRTPSRATSGMVAAQPTSAGCARDDPVRRSVHVPRFRRARQ